MMINNKKGFTLVEVLVAMIIFTFGVLAIIKMQMVSQWTNVKARGVTEAIVAAQNAVENISSMAYNDPQIADDGAGNLDSIPPTANDLLGAPVTAPSDGADFTNAQYPVYWNVQDNTPYIGTKTIRVIVRWRDRGLVPTYTMDIVKSDGV